MLHDTKKKFKTVYIEGMEDYNNNNEEYNLLVHDRLVIA